MSLQETEAVKAGETGMMSADAGLSTIMADPMAAGAGSLPGDLTPGEEAALQQQADAISAQLYQAYLAAETAANAASNPDDAANLRANAQQLQGMAMKARSMSAYDIRAGGLGPISVAAVAVIAQSLGDRQDVKSDLIAEQAEYAAYGATYYAEAGYQYSPYDMSTTLSQQYWVQRAMSTVDNIQHQQDERFVTDANGNITSMKGSDLSQSQLKDMTSLTTVDKLDVARSTEDRLKELAKSSALSGDAQSAVNKLAEEIHTRGNKDMLDEVAGSDYNKAAERTWDKMSDAQKAALGGDKSKYVEGFVAGQQSDEGAMTAAKSADIKKAYAELPADADPSVRTQMEKRATEAEFYDKFVAEKKVLLKEGAQDQALQDERVVAAVDIAEKKAAAENKTLSKEEIEKVIKEAKAATEKETPEQRKAIIDKVKAKTQHAEAEPETQHPDTAIAQAAVHSSENAAAADQSHQIAPDANSVATQELSPAEQAAMEKFGFVPKGLQDALALGSVLNLSSSGKGMVTQYGDPPLQQMASAAHTQEKFQERQARDAVTGVS